MQHRHTKGFYVFMTGAMFIAIVLFAYAYIWTNSVEKKEETVFGITFSSIYAEELGYDPVDLYKDILAELDVSHVRLPIYWSEVEQESSIYDWSVVDELMDVSEQQQIDLTLVIGMKVPRWPECHIPEWLEDAPNRLQHESVLRFIEEVVHRYKEYSSVHRWQVENESFFPFGECPTTSTAQLKERVDLVRSLDDKPIQITVSGELGSWLVSAEQADILGISMYRETWNDVTGKFVYPLTPAYYTFRSNVIRSSVSKLIVSELQMEPWFFAPIDSRPREEWYDDFTVEMFHQNVSFVQDTSISEVYLWGVEWWYALKQAGDDRLWEAARSLF